MHVQEYKAKGMDLSDAFADWEPITDVKGSVLEDVKKLRDLPMVSSSCMSTGRQWFTHCVSCMCQFADLLILHDS